MSNATTGAPHVPDTTRADTGAPRAHERSTSKATTRQFGGYARRNLLRAPRPMTAVEPTVFGEMQAHLDGLLGSAGQIRMLDAGCGKNRIIPIADDCHIVGIDMDASQIHNNSAIDEAILGDVQTHRFDPASFDAIVCWDVLEHLADPRRALESFERALKPGGVMVIAVPHARSVKGLVTRYTPFWFHNLVWRRLLGAKPDFEPFPTFMCSAMAPAKLRAFASEKGLVLGFDVTYEGWEQKLLRSRLRITGRAFSLVKGLVRMVSLGNVTIDSTDALFVMRKPLSRDDRAVALAGQRTRSGMG